MKGKWHIVAICVSISIVTVIFNHYFLLYGCVLWLCYLFYDRRLRKLPLIVSLTFLLFFTFYIPQKDITTNDNPGFQTKEINISGQINRSVEYTPNKIEFTLKDHLTSHTYLIVSFPPSDDHDIYHDYKQLKYGATCHIKGTVNQPERSRNPGQFDYQDYLASRGIAYQIVVDSLEDIECTGSSVFHHIFMIRPFMLHKVKEHFSSETSAWVSALVFGDQSQLNDDTVDLFRRWSLSHILAISGLHVGIIVAFIYFICVKLGVVTKETGEWILICFLPVYAIVAGGEPSVLRASTMVLFFLIINKTRSTYHMTDTISIVFLILIIAHPKIVYHIGFQLSFVVTFGLILSKSWFSTPLSMPWQLLKISFVSQMMIIPFQFAYFHTFHPLSILLNFIVVPYFSIIIIPTMFLLIVLIPVSPLTLIIDKLFVFVHDVFHTVLMSVDQYVYHPMILGDFPLVYAVVYYMLFVICMFHAQQHRLMAAFKYGCAMTLLIVCLCLRPYVSPIGTVTMLDIGQGDAFVIELPYRKGVIFIDAGATFSFDDFEPTKKVYEQIIRPYLYSRGIGQIDAIFLSHDDLDHNGSAPFMIEDMGVRQLIISEFYQATEKELSLWDEESVHVHHASFNDEVIVNGHSFYILSPNEDMLDDNENSLVIFTKFGGKRWLFTGDIGKRTEKQLITLYPHLSVDVLKVAHHGSHTSTDHEFIRHIQPSYALISAGINNSFGHPTDEVLETLHDENVYILRTDEDGAVQFQFRKNEGTFFKYLP